MMVQIGFVWTLLCYPISFPLYTLKFNYRWYGWLGTFLTLLYPVTPLALTILQVIKTVQSWFVADWTMSGPGRVFFIKPNSFFGSFFWDGYIIQSMFLGQFWICGTNEDAIEHTWYDAVTTKEFWHKTLENVNGKVPRKLATWDGTKITVHYPEDISDCHIVMKVNDSYLGIGDLFWAPGIDFRSVDDVEQKL